MSSPYDRTFTADIGPVGSQCLVVLAGLQVLVGLLLLSHRADIERARGDDDEPDQLRTQAAGIVVGGAIVHGVSAIVHLWLSAWCRRGRG
jgi:hypothetical protein